MQVAHDAGFTVLPGFAVGLGEAVAEMEGAVVEDLATRKLKAGRSRTVGEDSLARSERQGKDDRALSSRSKQ